MTRVLTLEDFPPVPFRSITMYEIDDVIHMLSSIIYKQGYHDDTFMPVILPTVSEMSQYFCLSELDIIRAIDGMQQLGITVQYTDTLTPVSVTDAKPTMLLKLSRWIKRVFPHVPYPLKNSLIY